MKRFISLLFVFVATSSLFAQTQQGIVKTRGRMTATGAVIPGTRVSGATVNVRNISSVVSNSKGSFSFVLHSKAFYLTSVQKQGYMLCDNDILNKSHQYSANPFVVVMETPENNTADRLAAEKKIRRTLQRQLQDKEDEIEALKAQQKITEAEYNKKLQELYAQQKKNDNLIEDMAKRYSTIDFDEMDEFQRKVAFYIQNGELMRADSLLNTKGSMDARSAELDRMDAAIKTDAEDLAKRQAAHDESVKMKAKALEDFAADCYSRYEICKLQHKNDSAAYWLELRASKDTMNIIWLYDVANFYRDFLMDYDKSYTYYIKVLDMSIKKYGEESHAVGTAYVNLGQVLYSQYKYEEAKSFTNKAIMLLKDTSPELLSVCYNSIALIHKERHEYSEALEYYTKAVECDSLYGRQHDLATVYDNLGQFYYSVAKYDKAYEYMLKSLKIRESEGDDANSSLIYSYSNIGTLFQQLGKYQIAMKNFEKAISIAEKLYGETHPITGTLTSKIAMVYFSKGEYSTAMQFHQRAYEIGKETLGKSHREVAVYLANIGSTYRSLGKPEESKDYCLRALEILLIQNGEKDLKVASCYTNIAGAYNDLEDYTNAIIYEHKALKIEEELLPPNHPILTTSYNNLSLSYLNNNDLEKAKEYHKKSMDLLIAKYGEKHPNIAGAYNNLGQICMKMEQYEDALDNYRHSLEIAVEYLGDKHKNVATVYYNMAKSCYLLGRISEACDYINKAYSICLEKLGTDHTLTKIVIERKNEYGCE